MIKAVIFDMYETLITHYASPLYFSEQMARDASIPVEIFRRMWRGTNDDRTEGRMTFEQVITWILEENGKYSKETFEKIVAKRIEAKRECFRHLHQEILPMLEELKQRKIKIGLISNCFSEEVVAIRESCLFLYFDSVCLSYEQGIQKPEKEIYIRCMRELSVKPEECIYVGDGGSNELEAAKELSMRPVQALWYLKDAIADQSKRKPLFEGADQPMELMRFLE